MITDEILTEAAANELAQKLPSLRKHNYDTIDTLMRNIASKHHITGKALHDLFVKKFKRTPDEWVKGKLDETDTDSSLDIEDEVNKFAQWTGKKLNLKKKKIKLYFCFNNFYKDL